MIVKILASSASFAGVRYNHEKMRSGKGELLTVKNFGTLMVIEKPGPQDYINYLKAVSAVNKRVKKPQLHAVISGKGKSFSKFELSGIAEKWLAAMGYGQNPYLIVFHNDTANNHVHIVSTRIDKSGKKISSVFEKIRALSTLAAICRKPETDLKTFRELLKYRYSTPAQLKLLLEKSGFGLKPDAGVIRVFSADQQVAQLKLSDIEAKCNGYIPDKARAQKLRAIFKKILYSDLDSPLSGKSDMDLRLGLLANMVRRRCGAELVFHAKDGKLPYGYTILDHNTKTALKGSVVMPLKEILDTRSPDNDSAPCQAAYRVSFADPRFEAAYLLSQWEKVSLDETTIKEIELKEDIDDEAIHGRNRQRKGKARTNTR